MSITDRERAVLAALADVLIPKGEEMPSASQAGVSGIGLDRVLAARPDLAEPLRDLLSRAGNGDPGDFLDHLRATDAPAFGVLEEIVPAAYFMDPDVRRAIGYAGQVPRSIDPRADFMEDGLLESVIRRGPIYRATPQ